MLPARLSGCVWSAGLGGASMAGGCVLPALSAGTAPRRYRPLPPPPANSSVLLLCRMVMVYLLYAAGAVLFIWCCDYLNYRHSFAFAEVARPQIQPAPAPVHVRDTGERAVAAVWQCNRKAGGQ